MLTPVLLWSSVVVDVAVVGGGVGADFVADVDANLTCCSEAGS
jgi:hypothetical protein